MKKHSIFLFLFILAVTYPYAQNSEMYSLDEAIRISAENMDEILDRHNVSNIDIPDIPDINADMDIESIRQRAEQFAGDKPIVAILNFSSHSNELSSYVVEELILALAGNDRFIIVDRQRLALIRQEENFQLSGEVSEESAQSIGKKLGAQYVITGSLTDMNDFYRFRIMALVVETAVISAPTSVNVNYKDRQIAHLFAKKIEDDKRIASAEEARRKEEEREQKRLEREAAAAEHREKWDDIKENGYLNMIQTSGIAFQSDKDFSYIFDELGVRWSFLPFTSIGLDIAFGGNTKEPVSYSTDHYRSGGRYGRAEELKAMGLKEEEECPLFYGYVSAAAGLVLPFTKNDAPVRLHLFGNGLIQYGTTVYPGLFGDSFTPGFDSGFNFAFSFIDKVGLGMNIKYKGLFYKNNRYTHGILIGLTLSFSEHNQE